MISTSQIDMKDKENMIQRVISVQGPLKGENTVNSVQFVTDSDYKIDLSKESKQVEIYHTKYTHTETIFELAENEFTD